MFESEEQKQKRREENELGLSDWAMVEDALKFYFKEGKLNSQEEIQMCGVMQKALNQVQFSLEDYKKKRGITC